VKSDKQQKTYACIRFKRAVRHTKSPTMLRHVVFVPIKTKKKIA